MRRCASRCCGTRRTRLTRGDPRYLAKHPDPQLARHCNCGGGEVPVECECGCGSSASADARTSAGRRAYSDRGTDADSGSSAGRCILRPRHRRRLRFQRRPLRILRPRHRRRLQFQRRPPYQRRTSPESTIAQSAMEIEAYRRSTPSTSTRRRRCSRRSGQGPRESARWRDGYIRMQQGNFLGAISSWNRPGAAT